jgi:hypothetical protein
VDSAGWTLFGLVATAMLTAAMINAQLLGWSRLDIPLLLGAQRYDCHPGSDQSEWNEPGRSTRS